MAKKKFINCAVLKSDNVIFESPVGSPDIVVGLIAALAAPANSDMQIVVSIKEIDVPNEKENN